MCTSSGSTRAGLNGISTCFRAVFSQSIIFSTSSLVTWKLVPHDCVKILRPLLLLLNATSFSSVGCNLCFKCHLPITSPAQNHQEKLIKRAELINSFDSALSSMLLGVCTVHTLEAPTFINGTQSSSIVDYRTTT